MSTKHKNIKLFSWEKGLLEIKLKGFNARVVNSIWLKMSFKKFFLFNPQNNYFFSLYIRNINRDVQVLLS